MVESLQPERQPSKVMPGEVDSASKPARQRWKDRQATSKPAEANPRKERATQRVTQTPGKKETTKGYQTMMDTPPGNVKKHAGSTKRVFDRLSKEKLGRMKIKEVVEDVKTEKQ